MEATRGKGQAFGDGLLTQVSNTVYRWLVLAVGTAASALPAVLAASWLAPTVRNLPWFIAVALPLVPAIAAGSHAALTWRTSDEVEPVGDLWRGWRVGARGVVRWWLPVLLVGTVLVVDLAFAERVAGGQALRLPAMVALVLLAVLSCHLVVVTTSFNLRTRDALRIALHALGAHWRFSLYALSLLVAMSGIVIVASPAAGLLLAWAFVLLLTRAGDGLRADVRHRFISD